MNDHKQIAQGFLTLAFNERRPEEAFDRYVHPDYVQHNPHSPDGAEAAAKFLGAFIEQFPSLRLETKRLFVDDDHVITHCHLRLTPQGRGSAVVDIMRIEDGRIVEHWDVVQDIPEHSANDNTMF